MVWSEFHWLRARGFWRVVFCNSLLLSLGACGGGTGHLVTSENPTTLIAITVSPENSSLTVGGSQQFTATGTFSDNSSQNLTSSATWSSSSSATATVQNNGQLTPGLATAVGVGTATISAAVSGVSGKATLTVNPTLVSMVVTPPSPAVAVGGTQQFVATGTYSDNSTQNITSSASWTSSSTATATVQTSGQASPGLATGVTAGTTNITATVASVSGSTTLTVLGLTSLVVSPTTGSIQQNGTVQLSANATYSNGSGSDVTSLATWVSSNTAVAIVQTSGQTAPGLVTGVGGGTSTITATYDGKTSSATFTVSSAVLKSISVSPSSVTVGVGTTQQFSATATYSDSSTGSVTNSASWSSSNSSVATIQSSGQVSPGLATGVAAGGPITIAATLKGLAGTASVTVTSSASGTKIPLMDMTAGETYQGFAGGLYGNGSDTMPSGHNAEGLALAGTIQPLDTDGNPSPSGKVILTSIGMSNAADEFGAFKQYIASGAGSSSVDQSTLVVLNGALGGMTACYWVVANGPPPCSPNTENQFDRVQETVLAPNYTQQQVQAVWIEEANGGPGVQGCGSNGAEPCNPLCNTSVTGCTNTDTTTEALRYEMQLGEIFRAAKSRWPNLRVAFPSSRIYGGYATTDVNPEPYAYEYGFSVQWLIQAQINQENGGPIDPVAGDLCDIPASSGGCAYGVAGIAPWVGWGPYTWANGATPRSDGLVWCNGQTASPCNGEQDFQSDGTHPSTVGSEKVAYGRDNPGGVQNLFDFFMQSPYTESWFAAAP